jgi:hypothetical protein
MAFTGVLTSGGINIVKVAVEKGVGKERKTENKRVKTRYENSQMTLD